MIASDPRPIVFVAISFEGAPHVEQSIRQRLAGLDPHRQRSRHGAYGVAASYAKVAGTTVTGAGTAIRSIRTQVKDSILTGNDLDIDSSHAPKVQNTVCDTSNGWAVCAND